MLKTGWFTDAKIHFEVCSDGTWGNTSNGHKGDLKVTIQKCEGLDDADYAGTTDPYAYITIDGCDPQQTTKKSGTLNPKRVAGAARGDPAVAPFSWRDEARARTKTSRPQVERELRLPREEPHDQEDPHQGLPRRPGCLFHGASSTRIEGRPSAFASSNFWNSRRRSAFDARRGGTWQVYDDDGFSRDDCIGHIDFPLSKLKMGGRPLRKSKAVPFRSELMLFRPRFLDARRGEENSSRPGESVATRHRQARAPRSSRRRST